MATTKPDLNIVQDLVTDFGDNATYVADLLARYRTNPASVDEDWRAFFRERFGEPEPAQQASAPPRPQEKPAAAPAAAAVPAPAPEPETLRAPREGEKAEPLRGVALRIAENMEESLRVPTATSQRLIPVKLLEENRRVINDYRSTHDQSKIS